MEHPVSPHPPQRLNYAGPIVVMDGECALCSHAARIIAHLDRRAEFRICPAQSETGRFLLAHFGVDPVAPDTWLYVEDGAAYFSLEGVMRAGRRLGGWGRLASFCMLLPRPAQDWLYRRIARNRYRLFGRTHLCRLPDARLRARLMQ